MIDKQKAAVRLGETKIMNCGLTATITAYRNVTDIDVKFEDGVILLNKKYPDFQKGSITHPLYKKKYNRLGETKVMNCGKTAKIIAYKHTDDIDIEFEDGEIVLSRKYSDFRKGSIRHPSYTKEKQSLDRIGESKTMNCGIKATIIEYRAFNDIDIQFEDGVIIKHKKYINFQKGSIGHPNIHANNNKNKRINEKRTMKYGLDATIIEYKSYNNITIKFEDGVVLTNCFYEKFKKGEISHPNYKSSLSISKNEFSIMFYLKELGFRKIKQGEFKNLGFGNMELDLYNEDLKIAIEYDGVVHKIYKTNEKDLRKNKICQQNGIKIYRIREAGLESLNDGISRDFILTQTMSQPFTQELADVIKIILRENNLPVPDMNFERDKENIFKLFHEQHFDKDRQERLGLSKKMNCGKFATIINYKSSADIDIQFEDGVIVKNKTYLCFSRGEILHPSLSNKQKALDRIGESKVMACGLLATIIAYRCAEDIDLQIENGVIVKNKRYADFQRGNVSCVSYENRINESKMMNCGVMATIIEYRTSRDIDVQLEDGTIMKNKRYSDFQRGSISYSSISKEQKALDRLNETKTMNCGVKATIIKYHNSENIDIQFEDGVIIKNRRYADFQSGGILHPDFTNKSKAINRIGETKMMNCGINATIVKYYNSENIDIQFEDGTIVKNKHYDKFKNGRIMHPTKKRNIKYNRINESRIMNSGMSATIIEYRSSTDIDIQFEDGTISKNKRYNNFKEGKIAHPSKHQHTAKAA